MKDVTQIASEVNLPSHVVRKLIDIVEGLWGFHDIKEDLCLVKLTLVYILAAAVLHHGVLDDMRDIYADTALDYLAEFTKDKKRRVFRQDLVSEIASCVRMK